MIQNLCLSKKFKKIWKGRNLSLIGRNVVLKSLAISKLIYACSSIHIDESLIKEVQSCISKFVWNSTLPKVKASVMYQGIPDGGMKLLHFNTQIHALLYNWIRRLFNGKHSKWKSTFQEFIRHTGMKVQDIFYSRCSLAFDITHLPLFYQDLITTWQNIQSTSIPNTGTDIMNEMLWHNNFITIEGKPIFFKTWYRKGVRFIRDIVDDQGIFITEDQLRNKFNIVTNFLEYFSLRSAIPGHWKALIIADHVKIPQEVPVIFIQNSPKHISYISGKEF